jgi:hypothetical protein
VVGAGRFGVEGQAELFVPVEGEEGAAAGAVAGDVGRVGSDLVRDHALLDVFLVPQAQVFFGRDLAEHRRAAPVGEGGADGRRDVIVVSWDMLLPADWPRKNGEGLDNSVCLYI